MPDERISPYLRLLGMAMAINAMSGGARAQRHTGAPPRLTAPAAAGLLALFAAATCFVVDLVLWLIR